MRTCITSRKKEKKNKREKKKMSEQASEIWVRRKRAKKMKKE